MAARDEATNGPRPAVVAVVGDLFGGDAEVVVVPFSVSGSMSGSFGTGVGRLGLKPPPRGSYTAGQLIVERVKAARATAEQVVFAAVVATPTPTPPDLVEGVVRQVVDLAARDGSAAVALPLLGTGAGKLSGVESARAIVAGSAKATAAGVQLRIHVLTDTEREDILPVLDERAASHAPAPATTQAPAPAGGEVFSETVRAVRAELGGTSRVTAARIARALQVLRPEYGGGRFTAVSLRTDSDRLAPVDTWLERVRGLYDQSEVARSRHQVLDGELTLLGLAALDHDLAEDLAAGDFLHTLTDSVAVRPRRRTTDRTKWSPDAPATEDLLGRERLAEALAERVRLLARHGGPLNRSFLIHVDGPWGAGKSSLFNFLRRQLTQRHEFVVVEVNAWRDQRIGVPWWTVLNAVQRAVTRDKPPYRRPASWLAGLADRLRAGWVPFLAAVLALGAGLILLATAAGFNLESGAKAADNLLKIVSLVSVAFAGVLTAARYVTPGSRRSARGMLDSNDNPMREVSRLFARAFSRARKPVVLLVDDLDRCDADYVVDFLEVIQTVVRDAPYANRRAGRRGVASGPYAFVAADGRWIRSSYERRYAPFLDTATPGRPLGYLFLEKVFQLHVRLPAITAGSKKAYYHRLLDFTDEDAGRTADAAVVDRATEATVDAESQDELIAAGRIATGIADPSARMKVLGDIAVKFSTPAVYEAIEHELRPFADQLDPNPRGMKLFVNAYGVLRSLRTLEENFVASAPLALWTAIEIRWPYLAEYLREHPDAIRGAANGNGSLPKDLERLLADHEVARLLGDKRWGPKLTPDLIRQCSGAQ